MNRLLVTHNHVRMGGHDVIAHAFLAFLVTNPMLMLVKWSGSLALSAHCSGWLVADETPALQSVNSILLVPLCRSHSNQLHMRGYDSIVIHLQQHLCIRSSLVASCSSLLAIELVINQLLNE